MGASPIWKVYSENREYLASFKRPEHAAALVSALGDGTTLRWGHIGTVWTEGEDGQAGDSYDYVAEVAHERQKWMEFHQSEVKAKKWSERHSKRTS